MFMILFHTYVCIVKKYSESKFRTPYFTVQVDPSETGDQ